MLKRRQIIITILFVLCSLLMGCVLQLPKWEVNSLSELKYNEVLIVGKIQVNPFLEQSVCIGIPATEPQKEYIKNFIISVNEDTLPPPRKQIYIEKKSNLIKSFYNGVKNGYGVPQKKTFFIKTLNKPFFISEIVALLEHMVVRTGSLPVAGDRYQSRPTGTTKGAYICLPARIKINILPNDKAIYIGTLYYDMSGHSIKNFKIKDQYNKALSQFKNKFGSTLKLRKALAIKVESNN